MRMNDLNKSKKAKSSCDGSVIQSVGMLHDIITVIIHYRRWLINHVYRNELRKKPFRFISFRSGPILQNATRSETRLHNVSYFCWSVIFSIFMDLETKIKIKKNNLCEVNKISGTLPHVQDVLEVVEPTSEIWSTQTNFISVLFLYLLIYLLFKWIFLGLWIIL